MLTDPRNFAASVSRQPLKKGLYHLPGTKPRVRFGLCSGLSHFLLARILATVTLCLFCLCQAPELQLCPEEKVARDCADYIHNCKTKASAKRKMQQFMSFCFKHKSFQSVIPKSQWDIKNRAIAEPQGKQISHQRTNRWSTIAILDFIVTLIIWVFATGGIRPVKGGASRVRTRHNVLVGLVLLLGRLSTQN